MVKRWTNFPHLDYTIGERQLWRKPVNLYGRNYNVPLVLQSMKAMAFEPIQE